MAKLKVVKFGDKRGVGSIISSTGLFGKVRTWTLVQNDMAGSIECWGLDKWVCRENGESHFREFTDIDAFYSAQFNTREAVS